MDLLIRHASLSDIESIVLFNRAMALETEKKHLNEEIASSGVRRLMLQEQYGFYIIAEIENKPVGQLMITYEWTDWRDGLFWWIQSVYVMPDFRGKGIYKALYGHILRESRKHDDVRGIRLYVDRSNDVAKNVYEKLGMSKAHYDMYEIDFVTGT
jgi:ribosomal protein S18 acetylase RimI-like enzyme